MPPPSLASAPLLTGAERPGRRRGRELARGDAAAGAYGWNEVLPAPPTARQESYTSRRRGERVTLKVAGRAARGGVVPAAARR